MTYDISGVINSLPMFFDEGGVVDLRILNFISKN